MKRHKERQKDPKTLGEQQMIDRHRRKEKDEKTERQKDRKTEIPKETKRASNDGKRQTGKDRQTKRQMKTHIPVEIKMWSDNIWTKTEGNIDSEINSD